MKKKTIGIIVAIIVVLIGLATTFFVLTRQDKKSTLTILEKQWIENNKNKVIDLSIQNNIPIFNYNGEGLIYEFLSDLQKDTELEFNIVPLDETTEYKVLFTENKEKSDIVIYSDNYALITKTNKKYNSLKDIKDLNIGVLNSDLETVSYYLNDKLQYTSYEKSDEMLKEFKDTDKLDGIVILKTSNLKEIIENNWTIAYNISEMTNNLVLRLGKEAKLNEILKKYYSKWNNENYQTTFNENLSNNYFTYSNIDNDEQVKFQSKRYKYGFVANIPYDKLINNRLVGINSEVIKAFSKVSKIEVTYTEYDSYSKMLKEFNENKIDFFFDQTNNKDYNMDIIKSPSIINEELVVLTHIKNNEIINSINSLKDKKVSVIENSLISSILEEKQINITKYKTLGKMLNNLNKNSIIVIDYYNYEIYKNTLLKNYEIKYQEEINSDYNYVLRDIKDNKIFNNYFVFYLTFINENNILNIIDYKIFEQEKTLAFVKPLVFTLFAIVCLLLITLIIRKIMKAQKDKTGIAKEDKLKYIDMLTSLKNRNFLNNSIEKWDESGVYPQTIIIVDLNNIAYINDNYGHNEGDNVIRDAANILIKNQLEQSEIIRTNGNEFLIYLVGYEEKQIVSYIRKLSKEFKELEHGFGAAIGYSMITDGLKTVDDAINEATLDMKANKEEAQHE